LQTLVQLLLEISARHELQQRVGQDLGHLRKQLIGIVAG
jgi:hypothetical protein